MVATKCAGKTYKQKEKTKNKNKKKKKRTVNNSLGL
jgi:hypothetical protein